MDSNQYFFFLRNVLRCPQIHVTRDFFRTNFFFFKLYIYFFSICYQLCKRQHLTDKCLWMGHLCTEHSGGLLLKDDWKCEKWQEDKSSASWLSICTGGGDGSDCTGDEHPLFQPQPLAAKIDMRNIFRRSPDDFPSCLALLSTHPHYSSSSGTSPASNHSGHIQSARPLLDGFVICIIAPLLPSGIFMTEVVRLRHVASDPPIGPRRGGRGGGGGVVLRDKGVAVKSERAGGGGVSVVVARRVPELCGPRPWHALPLVIVTEPSDSSDRPRGARLMLGDKAHGRFLASLLYQRHVQVQLFKTRACKRAFLSFSFLFTWCAQAREKDLLKNYGQGPEWATRNELNN